MTTAQSQQLDTREQFDTNQPEYLTEAQFRVVHEQAAQRYLPLFDHLSISETKKLQLIADLLTIIDHTFDTYLTQTASRSPQSKAPKLNLTSGLNSRRI